MVVTRRTEVRVAGRALFLTRDAGQLRRQLDGEALGPELLDAPLLDNVSTDELTPGWVCYYFDATLARYCLVGLRGGVVQRDDVRRGGFGLVVSGRSKGCGSSREMAPYAEREAGVRVVVAESFEKIYEQNCQNIGVLTTTDRGVVARLGRGEAVPIEEFARGLDPISRDVVELGGLFPYNLARLAGAVAPPELTAPPRPMTLAEKILAAHAVTDARSGAVGVAAVAPGDALFARADVRFSHEYVTPMAQALFHEGFGPGARVAEPESVYAFRDHLTFLPEVMSDAHVKLGLRTQAEALAVAQREFCERQGVRLYGEVTQGGQPAGSEAICHNKIIEDIALPGQLVIGTDSHTCMAGALGCFAFGVGSTDMANAWLTRDVRVAVPETLRFELRGRLRPGVAAKDVMLHLLALPFWKGGQGIGKVLEFGGEGALALGLDERATMTNMAVEAGGFTGIFEADDLVLEHLAERRGASLEALRACVVRPDAGAAYAGVFELSLEDVEPMVATPGDPRNGVALRELQARGVTRVDIAYGGSCTGGKRADMDMYAEVLGRAHAQGRRVAPGVELILQFGSQAIRRYAEERGYVALFEAVGARLVAPSCGACINAGPGVSTASGQVSISAINRNFPGRSGPGQVYLASPYVVAASAIMGVVAGPDDLG